MGNLSESFDIEDLMSYGDDLISLLNAKNGFEVVSQSFEDLKALRFVCDEDFNQTQRSIQDCKKKLVACKKKTEEASCGDDDVERLQRELDEEMEIECKLKDELR
ncbi:hypothetical protein IGI04_003913 [Brassica rapa subsp. trilocularis]|uniref:Uncharacterized protein n=1 Tax=Brassica rapa subsp. trilocularis TaxID=1813537 RepID=A0ABQ7P1U5_BRACM|nr:hypothetical protein IGI04_003913 [Brassica rapa subsp. trilocularis]